MATEKSGHLTKWLTVRRVNKSTTCSHKSKSKGKTPALTVEEKMIEDRLSKDSRIGHTQSIPHAWNNIRLRLVQIARDDEVWVLDMWKIKAMPKELKRILESAEIKKTRGGLTRDITVVWDDLRIEMRNLVDVGMMAKLVLAEKYPKMVYGNLALKTSVEDIIGFDLPKIPQPATGAAHH
ncbi:hypothetical protein B0H17DRAFT_1140121 [Mycena rosella]|uniref:3'-5' exonuclease domain-containing protein n=1 Tax=Mycena rosella TaxID=1033263 RepID=A0AAD7D453_MYCRO|nr:hypothetical protein B0H17DRAFT_1140121 [Mycena rosella]